MEQLMINFSETPNSVEEVFQLIVTCLATFELPTEMLSLKPLMQKGVANAVVIEKTMCKIVVKQSSVYILVHEKFRNEAEASNLAYTQDKAMENYIRIPITSSQSVFSAGQALRAAFKSAFRENADTSFGCCSRFNQCSDARKCINPDPILALGCKYRDNLENGRIFYGSHPTV